MRCFEDTPGQQNADDIHPNIIIQLSSEYLATTLWLIPYCKLTLVPFPGNLTLNSAKGLTLRSVPG
jgi:hypothetical protein